MTVHAQIPLWDYAEITATLVEHYLSGDLPNLKAATRHVDDFILFCAEGFQQLDSDESIAAMQRLELKLSEILPPSLQAKQALTDELIPQTQRRWCEHQDHLAPPAQADAGLIRNASACMDCYDSHLIELAEDDAFEAEYSNALPN